MTSLLRAVGLTIALASLPASGLAQPYGQAFGDIYLTTDVSLDPYDPVEGPASTCIGDPGLPTFTPLEFFLVITVDFADIGRPELNATNGLGGWEVEVHVPEELTIIACTVRPVSCQLCDCNGNFIVGTGVVITAASMPYAVVEYRGILLEPAQDMRFSLSASTPSSFDQAGGPGPVPGWLESPATGDCLSDGNPIKCLRPFRRWQGCENELVLNYTGEGGCVDRCALASESPTWSAVKIRY